MSVSVGQSTMHDAAPLQAAGPQNSPPRPSPTIWGLTVRDLHDAYWCARGVQVVRLGEVRPGTQTQADGDVSALRIDGQSQSRNPDSRLPSPQTRGTQNLELSAPPTLQRAAELYMLIEPGRLMLFNLREFAERLMWRNARATRLRIIDRHIQSYTEQVDFDDHENVRAIVRNYAPRTRTSFRIVLTTSRRLATIWQQAESSRAAWERIRRRIPWSSIDHWRCAGNCFNEDNPAEQHAFLNRMIDRWSEPSSAIGGIEQSSDGVWTNSDQRSHGKRRNGKEDRPGSHTQKSGLRTSPTVDALSERRVIIGPVWAGYGALPERNGASANGRDRGGVNGHGEPLHSGSATPQSVVIGPAWLPDTEPPPPDARAMVRPIHMVELAESVRPGAPRPAGGWANSSVKRGIDVALSALMLVVLSPLFVLIMALIAREDGRPIFFSHERQTRGGRNFRCWKFRTMIHNAQQMTEELRAANQADGPQFFIDDDPRVTRIGRMLRNTHLDELPQLYNVLLGQMSLVGPRPSPNDENQYCPAWRDARLSVRPGITGLWQLKRTRAAGADFQEWIKFDLEYVRTASPWLDFRIMYQTAISLLSRGFRRQRGGGRDKGSGTGQSRDT